MHSEAPQGLSEAERDESGYYWVTDKNGIRQPAKAVLGMKPFEAVWIFVVIGMLAGMFGLRMSSNPTLPIYEYRMYAIGLMSLAWSVAIGVAVYHHESLTTSLTGRIRMTRTGQYMFVAGGLLLLFYMALSSVGYLIVFGPPTIAACVIMMLGKPADD